MRTTYEDAIARLTGEGAPFEIVVEPVRGLPMRNWKHREKSMREKVANAGLRGEADFLVQGERRISYGRFAKLVWGAARTLADGHDFRRGDRLAVLAYNSPDWLIALFGAVSLGGIGVGLNGWWSSEEIEYGLRDSGSRVLVVDARLYPRVEPLLAQGRLESVEKIFYIGESTPSGAHPIDALIRPHDRMPEDPIDEDDPFVILYTSGTTGRAKGCITTHRGTIAQVTGIMATSLAGALSGASPPADSKGAPASLVTSPLFHVGGLHSGFCTAMSSGAKLVFHEGRFDPEQAMQIIEREKISVWGAIPTLLHRVVHHEKVSNYDLSSLKAVTFGGAPTPSETIEKARAVLPVELNFTNAYGLTETHGVVTVNTGKELLDKKSAIGRPMPLLDVKLVDAQGRKVPEGELGELLIYGPLVTPGYWNRPEATREAVRDGWLHTGDLGYRDEEGFIFLVDRARDMIIRGGENVYCTEIENLLADHPEIDEAAIIGVPDPELGERVKAVVRRIPGSQLSEQAVRRHVAARLASFKVPESVDFIETALPRNPAGKIMKTLLRGESAAPFAEEELT